LFALLCAEQMTVARVKSGCAQFEPGLRISVRECGSTGVAEETHSLGSDEIHVWHAKVSAMEASKLASRSLLSDDEISRMQRFHFEKDRHNFIFCRSMLRILLA
jgi:hypothetical protein